MKCVLITTVHLDNTVLIWQWNPLYQVGLIGAGILYLPFGLVEHTQPSSNLYLSSGF